MDRLGHLDGFILSSSHASIPTHREHPYACDAEKAQLARRTGLAVSQVALWLTNARKRKLSTLRPPSRSRSRSVERPSKPGLRIPIPAQSEGSAHSDLATPRIEAAEAMLALERAARVGSDGLSAGSSDEEGQWESADDGQTD